MQWTKYLIQRLHLDSPAYVSCLSHLKMQTSTATFEGVGENEEWQSLQSIHVRCERVVKFNALPRNPAAALGVIDNGGGEDHLVEAGDCPGVAGANAVTPLNSLMLGLFVCFQQGSSNIFFCP